MIDGKFDVVFRGQTVKSFELAEVKDNLVKLFKSSPDAVEKLFSGNESVIRKSLDYATAMKYQQALKKAGALALIKEVESKPEPLKSTNLGQKASFGSKDSAPEAAAEQSPEKPTTNPTPNPSRSTTEHGVTQQNRAQVGENSSAQTNETVKSASSLSESDEGNQGLSVAPPGTQIMPDKVYEKREVDTSALSVAKAGERILPDKPQEIHEQPNIDHLNLVD